MPDSAAPTRSDLCTRRRATVLLNEPRSKLGSRKKESPLTARQAPRPANFYQTDGFAPINGSEIAGQSLGIERLCNGFLKFAALM